MSNHNHAAVVCEKVSKTFKQGTSQVVGLDHVDLAVDAGDSICLSGPSGSGKTTLLNAIGGLATPDSGTIRIGEHTLSSMSDSERAQLRLHHIGFVFQSYNLVPVLSALENVAFIMEMQGLPKQEIDTLAHAILDRVGLEGLKLVVNPVFQICLRAKSNFCISHCSIFENHHGRDTSNSKISWC